MNLPKCPHHLDRKQQLTCLSDDCDLKFQPRCVQCLMSSKCKQKHIWKMISQTVEEIYKVCSATKEQHRAKGDTQANNNTNPKMNRKQIQIALKQLKIKANQFKDRLIQNLEDKANMLFQIIDSQVENYDAVKQILDTFQKDTESDQMVEDFKKVGSFIYCSQDGELKLIQNQSSKCAQNIDISVLQDQFNNFFNSTQLKGSRGKNDVDSQKISDVKKTYQSQIQKLQQQIKSLPMYLNRISALQQKLQDKDAIIKKLQLQVNVTSSAIRQEMQAYKKKIAEQSKKIKQRNVSRVKSLIERRKQLYNAFQQYTQKGYQEQHFIHNLKAGDNAIKIQVPVSSNVSYLLNQCSLSICDELQFIGYSDAHSGQKYVQIPLISVKRQQPKPQVEPANIDPLLQFLLGGK